MQYVFHTPIPIPWLIADIFTLLITLLVVLYLVKQGQHPLSLLLEGFGFVFLYASLFENFAVVQGWYVYGRSWLMVGDVPLSVPLIEMDVFLVGLWLLQKMDVPTWCKPFILGLFGLLQDFSLDPVATRQIFTVNEQTSGRWSWLLPPGHVNIYGIPVYNFPGWVLIMLYGSIYVLLGRWWFRRSGYKPAVGIAYPPLAFLLAFLTLVTPLSNFLLWLEPFFHKGSLSEWYLLGFHILFPSFLLLAFWRGRMKARLRLKADLPIFVVVIGFHLLDIAMAAAGGWYDVLWLVLLISGVHLALLGWIYYCGTQLKEPPTETGPFIEP